MFFKKSAPKPPAAPSVTVQDGLVAGAWGYTLQEWMQLTDAERRHCRANVVHAPRSTTATAS